MNKTQGSCGEDLGISSVELDRMKRLLGRTPNPIEIRVINALWSERCSYKSTKAHLSILSSQGSRLQVGPGEPGGLVDLSDDLVLVVRVAEQAPSTSLTGWGKSCLRRELLAQGASPIAELGSLVVGLAKKNDIPVTQAVGLKNRVLYVGAEEWKPDSTVDARLMRACQACIRENLVVGISSVGTAGLALASFSMAHRASTGLLLNLDEISGANLSKTPEELILAEGSERMLLVAEPPRVPRIKNIFSSFDLLCDDLGRVCGDGLIRITYRGHELVNLAVTLILENAPRYRRVYQSIIPKTSGPGLAGQMKMTIAQALAKIPFQFPRAGPAIFELPTGDRTLALSSLRYRNLIRINPFEGAKRAVWQGALEMSTVAALPQGFALAFSFGSPEDEALMTEFKHTIDGIAWAADTLNIPVLATTISVAPQAVVPELEMGLVGLSEPCGKHHDELASEGHILVMLGELPTDFSGAEAIFGEQQQNTPLRSWELEGLLHLSEVAREWGRSGRAHFMSVLGSGGLYQALAYIMTQCRLGIRLDFGAEWLAEELVLGLLSEDSPRILLSLNEADLPMLISTCAQRVPLYPLGRIEGRDFLIYHQGHLVYSQAHQPDEGASA